MSYFSTAFLDRFSYFRRDDEWIAARLVEETTRFVPVWQLQNFVTSEDAMSPRYLTYSEIQPSLQQAQECIFLGQQGFHAYFAVELFSEKQPLTEISAEFKDLRVISWRFYPEECAVLGYARGMVYWHQRHRYCGSCGSPTQSIEAGFVRLCTDNGCGIQHFPRIDPSIIVLISSGDACLLGRQSQWPTGMHSTIAGFVEPGERIEDTVTREVMEETGVEVDQIVYFDSDPWPFPSSLMLGFHANAVTTDIRVDQYELEHAAWYTREELKQSLRSGTLRLPMKSSISFRLIQAWYDNGQAETLQEVMSLLP